MAVCQALSVRCHGVNAAGAQKARQVLWLKNDTARVGQPTWGRIKLGLG